MAEKLDPFSSRLVLMANAIYRRDVNTVGDAMCALRGLPRFDLRFAVFCLFRRVPAYGCRIENDLRAEQAGDAGCLRVPLIPADQYADGREARLPDAKTARWLSIVRESRVPRREVVFLVKERIVGDVHLSVYAQQLAVSIYDRCRIAIHASRLPLENRCDYDDLELARELLQRADRCSRNGFCEIEPLGLLRLAEVGSVEQLLKADDLSAAIRGFAHSCHGARDVVRHVVSYGFLDQTDSERRFSHC